MGELLRANKITAHFEGDGVIVGTFYRTHDKLGQVRSNEGMVIAHSFVMPESIPASEGVDAVEVAPAQKLEAFKNFLQNNATIFGFIYDPVDRRPDAHKYPSKYDAATLLETASKVVADGVQKLAESVQKTVEVMVKNGNLPEGSVIGATVGVGTVDVQESYKNGSIKYADVKVPVTFSIAGQSVTRQVEVNLVSGQLKKPRQMDGYVFTITGLKTALTEAGVLPKVEKPAKEDKDAEPNQEIPAEA